MKKLTYSCLIQMRTNALWATEIYTALGIYSEAIRYYKILNRIEKSMWNYKAENTLIS